MKQLGEGVKTRWSFVWRASPSRILREIMEQAWASSIVPSR